MTMDPLVLFLEQFRPTAHYLYSGDICGLSPTHYTGNVGYLHILRAGALSFIPDNAPEKIQLHEPSIIFCSSLAPHRLMGAEDNPAKMLCASVKFGESPSGPFNSLFPPVMVFPLSRVKQAENCLNLLYTEADRITMGWQSAVDGLFEYLMTILIRDALSHQNFSTAILNSISDQRLSKCIELMHKDIEKNWTVSTLAQSVGMSRARFASLFAEVVGMTPIAYLTELRLTRVELLLTRGEPLKQAAGKAGFTSVSTMSRSFVRKHALTPKQWLEKKQRPAAQNLH